MATTKVVLTNSWQQVVPSTSDFIIENPTEFKVLIAFNSTTPSNDVGHTLLYGFGMSRMGAAGNVYAKIHPDNVDNAVPYLVVS